MSNNRALVDDRVTTFNKKRQINEAACMSRYAYNGVTTEMKSLYIGATYGMPFLPVLTNCRSAVLAQRCGVTIPQNIVLKLKIKLGENVLIRLLFANLAA